MIDFKNVTKVYPNDVTALDGVSLHVDRGEFVFIVGASGAGKSTFLKMIMREEVPTEGSIIIDGQELNKLRAKKVPYYRRKLGIVFQDFRLIPTKTVYENIAFAMHVTGAPQKDINRRVSYAMCLVGIAHKSKCYPSQLSGGEQQRVALARALVNDADIIIADEPTGNIDSQMSHDIFDLLEQININKKTTIIMVTHDIALASQYNKRTVTIRGGKVIADTAHPEVAENAPEEPEVRYAPSGYYQAPKEDREIDEFIYSYGADETPVQENKKED